MENIFLDTVTKLSYDKKLNGERSKKLADKVCQLITEFENSYYQEDKKLKRVVLASGAAVTMMSALFSEAREVKKREKIASHLFRVPLEQVTGDCATFIASKENHCVYVNDFQYDASVSLDKMRNLKAIWGNAHLEKLHDFQNLNLRVVMGNTYVSDAENMEQIEKLRIITGDLHIGDLKVLDYLNDSIYIGGQVYHQGKIWTASEQKAKSKQKIKH